MDAYRSAIFGSDQILKHTFGFFIILPNFFLCNAYSLFQISGPYLTCDQAKFIMDEISKLLIAGSLRRVTREHTGVAQDYSDAGQIQFINEVGLKKKSKFRLYFFGCL